MMTDTSTYDPYRSPTLPETPYAVSSGVQKPGWLTALCVICIVLGVLGLMNGLLGLGATLFGKQLQQMMNPMAAQKGMPAEIQKLQQNLQDETNSIQEQFFIPSLIAILVKVAVSTMLIVGGVRSLALKPNGRTLLVVVCVVALLFELG